MLVTIKPHSSFHNYFSAQEYSADFKTYHDLIFYLNAMHKRFINYLRLQKAQGIEESYVLLDKNLKIINPDELKLRNAKRGDVIHIVPAVVGGGGKRGGVLAALAIAFFIFVPMLAGMAAQGAATPALAGTAAGTTAGTAGAGIFGGLLQNLVVNVGLAILSSLFATKPSEENTRQNDMFGSLVNNTTSGTPVPLNYGLVRVAGQLISGYVLSVGHGKTQNLNIYGEVLTSASTSAATQELERALFLAGYNGSTATTLQIFTSSTNFTVPAGVGSITAIVVGGGGTKGNDLTHPDTSITYYGGTPGSGGLAIAEIAVTPGTVIPITVGLNNLPQANRTSRVGPYGTANTYITATGGTNGENAQIRYSSIYYSGKKGISGSGAASADASLILSSNVSTDDWKNQLILLRHKFVGSSYSTQRQQVIDLSNQTTSGTGTWISTGFERPGAVNNSGSVGKTGAVILIY